MSPGAEMRRGFFLLAPIAAMRPSSVGSRPRARGSPNSAFFPRPKCYAVATESSQSAAQLGSGD
jgi:hypothetical protein